MIMCDDRHEKICYSGRGDCPVCALIADLECAEYEIAELKGQIDDLEQELNNL